MSFTYDQDAPRSGLGTSLNLVGVAVVAYWLVTTDAPAGPNSGLVWTGSIVALAAWALRAFVRPPRWQDALAGVMVVAGSLATAPTEALLITPAIIGTVALTAEPRHRLWLGIGIGVVGELIVIGGVVVAGRSSDFLLGVSAGFALGIVVGFSRRQNAQARERERELTVRSLEVEREQQRNALLADRATIARDIHDVLAHSLGGLVIQLDAVEALLEAGHDDEARVRVGAARTLAAEGLGEARRAVATLRDPEAQATAGDDGADSLTGPDALERLLSAHESLGGTLVVEGLPALDELDPAHRRAALGVVRESLSNARRHAPGAEVAIVVAAEGPRIRRLTISNALPASPVADASPGGGHGVVGMRERFDALGDESSVDAGVDGGRWVVSARVEVS